MGLILTQGLNAGVAHGLGSACVAHASGASRGRSHHATHVCKAAWWRDLHRCSVDRMMSRSSPPT
jgi:hypothetical protein